MDVRYSIRRGDAWQRLTRVYLICDHRDHPLLEPNRARRLRDHLLSLGFEVRLPLAEQDDASQFSRDNRSKLKQCDAVCSGPGPVNRCGRGTFSGRWLWREMVCCVRVWA